MSCKQNDDADALKGKGNAAFQAKEYQKAIEYYTKAIEILPSGVYFSNRSAAQLAAGFPDKAEEDAQQCLTLAPQWTKAYIRLGDALRNQEKYQEALDAYREGLSLDPSNQVLQKNVADTQSSLSFQQLFGHRGNSSSSSAPSSSSAVSTTATSSEQTSTHNSGPGDVLDEFFKELDNIKASTKEKSKLKVPEWEDPSTDKAKVAQQEIDRLLQPNHEWINLNPFEVLRVDKDDDDELIRRHYLKLSSLVHPDKNEDKERAKDAFQIVKKAHQQILDPQQKEISQSIIDSAEKEVKKARKKRLKDGVSESELGSYEEELLVATRKAFAVHELRKRKFERQLKEHSTAEVEKEEEEKEKQEFEKEFKEAWDKGREQRVGNWQEFQQKGRKRRGIDNSAIRQSAKEKSQRTGA
eukprot:gb/GECG01011879.1/.p1 GENE.gb/GECG01011879.1/~~gb/GECG01011879.1/.p1  ORF type:complete len:411 (+),score=96.05 gb/GECG01011879.1/:1-1233(+)